MSRVRLDLSSFGVAKAGYRPDEWEDSAAHSVRRGRFAVADGATTAFRAAAWSHLLTSGWIDDPFDLHDDDAWSRWFAKRVEAWSADLAARDGNVRFYEAAAAQRGSFATLLGVALEVEDGTCRWNALAVGDACLFHVRAGELLTAFPIDDPDRFGRHPELVHTSADSERVLAGVKRATGSVLPDDHLFLATDALAEWLLRTAPDAQDLWETFAELDEGGFERLVADARRQGGLHNDDVTLLRCRVSGGSR